MPLPTGFSGASRSETARLEVPLCRGCIGEGLGVAIKVEDGSRRAKQAVALHLLRQLEWLTPMSLQELEEQVLILNPGVHLEVNGALKFQQS